MYDLRFNYYILVFGVTFVWQLKKIEDSVKFLRAMPTPLVIYGFTHDEKLKRRIVEETSSGCVVFNDAMIQVRPLLVFFQILQFPAQVFTIY